MNEPIEHTKEEVVKPTTADQPLKSSDNPIRKKKFWSADRFLSLMAFLISLGTFFTFAYQTYLIQKQQYAHVIPCLMLRTTDRQGDKLSSLQLQLVNNGIGPAFIRDIGISYQDSVYHQDPAAFFSGFVSPDSAGFSTQTIETGYVIPAGKERLLIDANSEYSARRLDQLSREAMLQITYASIYDEIWQIASNTTAPQKIE